MPDHDVEPELVLNSLSGEAARVALTRACGVAAWVDGMLARVPFASSAALFEASAALFRGLSREDKLKAFAEHPEIGANLAELRQRFAHTAELSLREQAGVAGADDATLSLLRDRNQTYKARFGYVFIVCASGKSAREMLTLLEARLPNDAETELAVAASELTKITHLRLQRLGA